MDEIIRKNFDRTYKTYDAYTKKSFALKREKNSWKKLYSNVLKDYGKDVLNVGCGPGTEALILADMGYNVTALDFSLNMIKATKANAEANNLSINTVHGDAEDLPFNDCSFDIIVCNYALWAMPNPQKVICEWIRVLRPGGIVAYIDGENGNTDYSWFRKRWMNIAERMRAKDRNSHRGESTNEEREYINGLWSTSAKRPETDIKLMKKAGFSDVSVINKID